MDDDFTEYERCTILTIEFYESDEFFPSGNPENDYNMYREFMNSISKSEFIKYPGLEACLSHKIISNMFEILDDFLEMMLINHETYEYYEKLFGMNNIDGNINNYKFLEKQSVYIYT